ncbi:MAG: phosphopantothenoylcysteine decarboxylase [Phycisphaeraceae bacterium]|nr:phosphopantothenoylcysteine decarboxylase [Phycisphaeraceae bacterium]
MITTGFPTPLEHAKPLNVLITAGPTQEPIDDVRFIGNRSSGQLGLALAREAVSRGHKVTLLLGPVPARESGDFNITLTGIRTHGTVLRFRTTEDLRRQLLEHSPNAEAVIMSAAVADYRPKGGSSSGKIRRGESSFTIELESTPDLLAMLGSNRQPGQLLVGFALEPPERLEQSAREKLQRKAIDLIVANPLETMESGEIKARVLGRRGEDIATDGKISKSEFAPWLLNIVESVHATLSA